ncbi:sigma-70 family RNA polymerase sigma factor [Sphingomonas cannabina]|uniref:RNA polymerase sigma factor n=1 Tax=Sphingomonas cannabina TaxID=2899123 RepID=UPI001F4213E1|nr:sigma-70 family RNA polymerase sigma factor [Sphingomonas cannabina]UIJ44799.1 sigma-70 family RNA polymerase sigma factor [Sphingomonas cannabina]
MRVNVDPVSPAGQDGIAPANDDGSPGRLSLDALYRAQAGRLFRLFVRRASSQEADDLVQETFARFAGAGADRNISILSPERYLTRIAGNLLRDKARSASQRAINLSVSAEDAELTGPNLIANLEARDLLNRVEQVILRLKPMTREIFIAAHFHGLSRAEIAEQTGLSIKGVEKHMSKAYAHIHRSLGRR